MNYVVWTLLVWNFLVSAQLQQLSGALLICKNVMLYPYNKSMYMSHVSRKPVFGVFDQVTLILACSASEAS